MSQLSQYTALAYVSKHLAKYRYFEDGYQQLNQLFCIHLSSKECFIIIKHGVIIIIIITYDFILKDVNDSK